MLPPPDVKENSPLHLTPSQKMRISFFVIQIMFMSHFLTFFLSNVSEKLSHGVMAVLSIYFEINKNFHNWLNYFVKKLESRVFGFAVKIASLIAPFPVNFSKNLFAFMPWFVKKSFCLLFHSLFAKLNLLFWANIFVLVMPYIYTTVSRFCGSDVTGRCSAPQRAVATQSLRNPYPSYLDQDTGFLVLKGISFRSSSPHLKFAKTFIFNREKCSVSRLFLKKTGGNSPKPNCLFRNTTFWR